ncbi:hypothetical protein IU485_27925 [Nocardia cyriacigeorgica]|uniref:hypothetical protein n=1 Tax=Nocardia cyriacigeorgica TaxID=135487 RepID=UPI0018933FCF|nr:hypothetical protein [Nocardia cyriacigeorgica]MBF6085207.1 hypothetical protein [Nocardia cyriacigeorgica]
MLDDITPIEGGYCVKRLDDQHCVDVLRMMVNWRVVETERPDDESPHLLISRGYCYFGHGEDAAGNSRTMASAFRAALAAAAVWDGQGDPPGFDKRAF